jgi:GntR family transcriptional regulator, gluconate operon transcriptional repressor
MASNDKRLSTVLDFPGEGALLGRTLLSEEAAETLRSYISSGRVPEGTKLTEGEVSTLLGISRSPAREALKILESEGLVIVRRGVRYVTTLTEKDVRDLHELRCNLETLAIRLAAERVNEQDRLTMSEKMADLEKAAKSGDPNEWTRCDLALHRSLWQASGNSYLLKILDSFLGAIFILADRDKTHRDRDVAQDLKHHRDLIDLVSAGKAEQASDEMQRHLTRSLQYTLDTFQLSEPSSEQIE